MRTLLDGIDIPTPSSPVSSGYRTAAAPTFGMARLLILAACGLGGVLALGGAGWALFGRGTAPVPMIEADSRPIRVKPDNPGGMQVVGAEEAAAGPQMMAPATEAPAPQALRAQLAPAPRPATPPTAPGTSTGTPPAITPNVPVTVTAASVPTPTVIPPTVRPAVSAGRVSVQLGALETEAQGRVEWDRLVKRLPALGTRQPQFVRADVAGHTVWRLRTGGFTDTAEATAFCVQVKARGGSCALAF